MTDHEALEALSKKAEQTEDDIRYYSGGSKYNEPLEQLKDTLVHLYRTGQLVPAPSVDDVALAICKADGDCPCEVSCHKPGDIFHTHATAAISAMQVKP